MKPAVKPVLCVVLLAIGGAVGAIVSTPVIASSVAWWMGFLDPETTLETATQWSRALRDLDASAVEYVSIIISAGLGRVFAVILSAWYAGLAALLLWFKTKQGEREVSSGVYETGRIVTSHSAIARRCFLWDGEAKPEYGIVVGAIRKKSAIFPANHAVCIAPSGSSKTRGSVYQTADSLTFAGENSLLITDPSGEIHAMMREGLERRGYEVRLLDLASPMRGSRTNPISAIRLSHLSGDSASAEAAARAVGDALAPEQGSENDVFIRGAGGVISAIAYLLGTLDEIPSDQRHLWSLVSTVLAGTVNGTEVLKSWIRSFGTDSPPVAMAATFLASEGKLESSILSSLHDALQFLTSMHIKWLTSADDFSPRDLMRRKLIVFVKMLPPGNQANKLVSLLLTQYVNEMLQTDDRSALRPVYVLADEAHAIPKFPLVTAVEQGRKFGLHFYLWLQSNQGLDPYKTSREDGKAAILANADVKVLYKAGTPSDAELFSKYGGERTVRARSTNASKGVKGGGSSEGFSEQRIQNWPISKILNRDPKRDGVLVTANIAHNTKSSGCFEIPIADVTESPTAKNFSTFGSREHESGILKAEAYRLAALASTKDLHVEAWVPQEFKTPQSSSDNSEEDIFGFGL